MGGTAYAVSQSDDTAIPAGPAPSIVSSPNWKKYDWAFQAQAFKYGYPWQWLKAIALNESLLGTNPLVVRGIASSDGLSYGLMQLTLPTASDLLGYEATPQILNNDDTSIELAARYINQLWNTFGNDRQTIMSYNQGPGNTKKGKEYAAEYFNRWSRWMDVITQNP